MGCTQHHTEKPEMIALTPQQFQEACTQASQPRIIRKPEITKMVGLGLTTIDTLESKGLFPKRIRLSARSVGWDSRSVLAWLDARSAASN
jgi:predicted DNA-binding transcriptional regulator AlpA